MASRYCDGHSRRSFMQAGLAGGVGLGLSQLMRSVALGAEPGKQAPQAKHCIFIWMDGGPSHYETFDLKPNAPVEIRGEFDPMQSNVPGLHVCNLLPKTSQVMDLVTVIRSISHHDPGHGGGNHYLTTGRPTPTPIACGDTASFHPSFGSIVSKERGSKGGMPPYVQFALPSPQRSGGPSFLGSKYAPFLIANNPNNPDFQLADVTLPTGVVEGRAMSRLELRQSLDSLERMTDEAAADPARGLDNFYDQAQRLITSPQAKQAFDLSQESDKVRDTYGRTMVGQQCLLARRLVEAGVPFITVQHAGWDHHTNIFTYLKNRYLPIFDVAFAALMQDLEQRGLLEDTLVLALGEFGRTPKINKDAGRDHWPGAMSVVAAGAGVPRGQIIGSTDSHGRGPEERPLKVEDLACSLFTKLGINPHQEYLTPQGRPVPIVDGGQPIRELF